MKQSPEGWAPIPRVCHSILPRKIALGDPAAEDTGATMQSVPVRKLFWEALELALETQTHRLVKEIASAVGQPEAPLRKALREETVRVHLVDETVDQDVDIEEHRCCDIVRWSSTAPYLAPCHAPVLWSGDGPTKRCLTHTIHPSDIRPSLELPVLERLRDDDGEVYSVDTLHGYVYDEAGHLRGRHSNGTLRIFTLDE